MIRRIDWLTQRRNQPDFWSLGQLIADSMAAMIAYDILVQTIADWRADIRPTAPSLPPIPSAAPEVVEEYDSGIVDIEDGQYGEAQYGEAQSGEAQYDEAQYDAGEASAPAEGEYAQEEYAPQDEASTEAYQEDEEQY